MSDVWVSVIGVLERDSERFYRGGEFWLGLEGWGVFFLLEREVEVILGRKKGGGLVIEEGVDRG